MEHSTHQFSELFQQLGLPSTPQAVQSFISAHAPIPAAMRLEDAAFWSASQARLLSELMLQDADWSALVDQLNAALH